MLLSRTASNQPGSGTSPPEDIYLVSTGDVDLKDEVPILIFHIFKTDIPQDARIVDQDVYPFEMFNRCRDDSFSILDAVIIGNCISSSSLDLFDYFVGSLCKYKGIC